MIELTKDKYVVAFWFAQGTMPGGRPGNYLMVLFREAETYLGQYRFRYFADSGAPFDGKDEFSWYTVTMPLDQTEDEVVDKINSLVAPVISLIGPVEFVEVRGDGERAGKLLMEQTFTTWREEAA